MVTKAQPIPGRLTTADDMKTFALAGSARLTLVSEKTGTRYTYRIRRPKEANASCPWFVQVMYGPDNETQYAYLGTIYPNNEKSYRHGLKSNIPEGDVREKAFQWFWNHAKRGAVPPQMQVWHEGACCRCGRTLTVPESIRNGIGPECIKHVARPMVCEAA